MEVTARGGFGEAAALGDPGGEVAVDGEVHDEVDSGFCGHDFVDLEDVRVGLEAMHGGYLVEYAGFHGGGELR